MLLFQFSGCTTTRTEDDDTTNTFVRITSMRAADTAQGDDLFSDVCLRDTTTLVCYRRNDEWLATAAGTTSLCDAHRLLQRERGL